jgi:hypothetical protein
MKYQLFSRVIDGSYAFDFDDTADVSITRQITIGTFQLADALALLFAYGWWIVRACRNCFALAERQLLFSPAWSLGCFFFPIVNLWKPFQAMRQIWTISANSDGNEKDPVAKIVIAWWALFLMSASLQRANFQMADRAVNLAEILTSMKVALAADIVSIASYAISIVMLTTIWKMQSAQAAKRI